MCEITIGKPMDSVQFFQQIDKNEADADCLNAISENSEDIRPILHRESVVGLAQLEGGRHAFLYLYIFPAYRRKGFGKAAAFLLEQEMNQYHPVDISTCYKSDNLIAYTFAKNCGYTKAYSSDYMVYSGPRFEPEEVSVRQYQDRDYDEVHSFYAEAFHLMRLGTGLFPDSVPNPPSEGERAFWADTAKERLIYLDGDEIVGYAHIQGGEIGSICVKPCRQGTGVGKRFLKHIVNLLMDAGHPEVSLYCVVGNDRARRLYDALGFVPAYRNDYAKKELP